MLQNNFQKFCQIIQEGVLGPGVVHRCGSDELLYVFLKVLIDLINH